VTIDAPQTARNADGSDPSSSTDVSNVYSRIRCGDDNVAIKTGNDGPAAHITAAHDRFYPGHGMSIGSETNGGVSAIDVRDLGSFRRRTRCARDAHAGQPHGALV
jgi:polygalacturonase